VADVNYRRSPGHGVLPDNLGRRGDNLFSILDFNDRASLLPPELAVAAVSRDAPVSFTVRGASERISLAPSAVRRSATIDKLVL
jgi:hypothetical protein